MLAKRKTGARFPSGQLKESETPPSPAAIKRLRDSTLKQVHLQEWGTVCGGLFLTGKIDAAQYEASQRWDRHVTAYRAAIGGPSPVKAIDVDRGYSHPADPDSPEGRAITKDDVDAVNSFDRARGALAVGGPVVYAGVQSAVERQEYPVGLDGLLALKLGLSLLAQHWGLTNQSESATSRHPPASRSKSKSQMSR